MKKYLFFLSIFVILISSSFKAQEKSGNDATPANTALIIIDIQDFYFPGGMLPLYKPEQAAEKAKLLLEACRAKGIKVIHVRHNASSGADIYKLVAPNENEKVISKDKANAFLNTDLLDYLKTNNIENLILCGMQTHMCLEATTRAASDYGFNCTVVEDACTTRDLKYGDIVVKATDVHYSTLNTLKGTYAKVLTTKEYLETLK